MSIRILLAVLATSVVSMGQAVAGLLPVNVTVTPDSGNYRWTYAIVLPTDSQIRSGDYFTIFDFAGLVNGTNSQPANWSFSTSFSGPVPPGLLPSDNPTIPNLTWTYTGPTFTTGQVGLGNFWAISQYDSATDSFFTAQTHRTSDGHFDANITDTNVPVPSAGPPGVPEPATLVMAALGMPFALAYRRWRAR